MNNSAKILISGERFTSIKVINCKLVLTLEINQIPSRIYGLDIMRTIAITYVMISHGYVYSKHLLDAKYYRWLVLDGVGLFFVLSGFLIGSVLIRQIETGVFGRKQLVDFWIRRWLRTLPAYLCVLTFLLVCYYVSHQHLPPQWLRYYVFAQNLVSPHPLFFGEAWSLSVEEWFYILLPLSLFLLVKLKVPKRWLILGAIIFVIMLVTVLRLYKVSQQDYFAGGNFGDQIVKVVITRLDTIMYGVLGAWLSFFYSAAFYKSKHALLIIGLILLVFCNLLFSSFFYTRLYFTLVPIGTLCLLPALSSLKQGKGWLFRFVTFISTISYSIYLCNHMITQRGMMPPIIKWLGLDIYQNAAHNFAALTLFWVLSITVAYGLYRTIEKPFMDLRAKLKTSK